MAESRAKGRSCWETCTPTYLSRLLREHVEKGDPVDVANFCMMLSIGGHGIAPVDPVQGVATADETPPTVAPGPEYSWAFDEESERYSGSHPTVQEAIEEAFEEDPDAEIVWVGVATPPDINGEWLADIVTESISESLYEQCGEAADLFEPNKVQREALGKMIEGWIDSIGGFSCWSVEKIKAYQKGDPDFDAVVPVSADGAADEGGTQS